MNHLVSSMIVLGTLASSCAGDCPMDAFPDAAEIASTPRANTEIELLALKCSVGWVADQALYDVLSADIVEIRTAAPAMAEIREYGVRSEWSILAEDGTARDRMLDGTEPDFQCVLDAIKGTVVSFDGWPDEPWVRVTADGIFDLSGVAAIFEDSSVVVSAEPSSVDGDGDTIRYDLSGSTRRYLLDDAGGDCESGCSTHHYYLWEVADNASPAMVAEWGRDDTDTEFGEVPAGFTLDDFACR